MRWSIWIPSGIVPSSRQTLLLMACARWTWHCPWDQALLQIFCISYTRSVRRPQSPKAAARYFGFVNGGVIPAALAARILADVWDQNAALHIMSPIAAKLEAICETWLVDLLDLPADTAAGFVSGTSTATLCGLLAGRNAILSRQGWDVGERGLFGAPAIRLVMSEAAHGSVRKALALLGIGQAQIEIVPGRRSRQNGHPRSTNIGRQYVADLAGGQCQQRRF